MTELKPRYTHDCKTCVFIGQIMEYDLYICKTTIIARYGNEGPEYSSGGGLHLRNLHLELSYVICDNCGNGHYGFDCPVCGDIGGRVNDAVLFEQDATGPWRKN